MRQKQPSMDCSAAILIEGKNNEYNNSRREDETEGEMICTRTVNEAGNYVRGYDRMEEDTRYHSNNNNSTIAMSSYRQYGTRKDRISTDGVSDTITTTTTCSSGNSYTWNSGGGSSSSSATSSGSNSSRSSSGSSSSSGNSSSRVNSSSSGSSSNSCSVDEHCSVNSSRSNRDGAATEVCVSFKNFDFPSSSSCLCQICLSVVSVSVTCCLPLCGHRYCRDCFLNYIQHKLSEGQVEFTCFHINNTSVFLKSSSLGNKNEEEDSSPTENNLTEQKRRGDEIMGEATTVEEEGGNGQVVVVVECGGGGRGGNDERKRRIIKTRGGMEFDRDAWHFIGKLDGFSGRIFTTAAVVADIQHNNNNNNYNGGSSTTTTATTTTTTTNSSLLSRCSSSTVCTTDNIPPPTTSNLSDDCTNSHVLDYSDKTKTQHNIHNQTSPSSSSSSPTNTSILPPLPHPSSSSPSSNCNAPIPHSYLLSFLLSSPPLLSRYSSLKFMRDNPSASSCPRCQHMQTNTTTTNKRRVTGPVRCVLCGHVYCYEHGDAHHGITCAEFVRSHRAEDRLTRGVLRRLCHRCPGCKAMVEKSGGCNHMTCTRCRTHFCWICGQRVGGGQFPFHYAWWNVLGCPSRQMSSNDSAYGPYKQTTIRLLFILLAILIGVPSFVTSLLSLPIVYLVLLLHRHHPSRISVDPSWIDCSFCILFLKHFTMVGWGIIALVTQPPQLLWKSLKLFPLWFMGSISS
eukprot:GHVS01008027.1.p1 GENE.GHVS01008027.1~~GHVS01008027.1.p1  ORF type:complete len:735 (+),score=207.66 GHVS01008027.1:439-2643(+)